MEKKIVELKFANTTEFWAKCEINFFEEHSFNKIVELKNVK